MADNAPLGSESGWVWTRAQALPRHSPSGISDLLARGTWQAMWPGVYADGGHAPDARQRAWAAVLAGGPGSVACGRTAARLWGLPLIDDDDPTVGAAEHRLHEVAVTRNLGAVLRKGRGHDSLARRQLRLADDDVTHRSSWPPVTSVARTLRDLGAVLSHEALVCAFDDALRRDLVAPQDVADMLARAKGARQIRQLVLAAEVADPGAQTPAETLARLLLKPIVPGLRCQVPVLQPWGELVAVLDLADDELMLAVEVDGKRGHAGAQMVAKDRRRDRRTGRFGWWTERVTWFEIRRQQAQLQRRIGDVAHQLQTARPTRAA